MSIFKDFIKYMKRSYEMDQNRHNAYAAEATTPGVRSFRIVEGDVHTIIAAHNVTTVRHSGNRQDTLRFADNDVLHTIKRFRDDCGRMVQLKLVKEIELFVF